jgi:hypothetical protein
MNNNEIENGFKGAVIGSLPYVEFTNDNEIGYYQDFGWKKPIPSGVKFHPVEINDNSIWFIADGYGVFKDNKYKLTGAYGNGKINIEMKDLDTDVVEYCKANCL